MTRKLSLDEVEKRLSMKGLSLDGPYLGAKHKAKIKCSYGHVWETQPKNIWDAAHPSGCPHCSGLVKLSPDEIANRLEGRGIKIISAFNGVDNPATFECECGCVWTTTANNVIGPLKTGCPDCKVSSFWHKTGCMIYIMLYGSGLIKIGMTNDLKRRVNSLNSAFNSQVMLYSAFKFGNVTGREIWNIEQKVHANFAGFSAGMTGFKGATEIFTIDADTAREYLLSIGGEEIEDEFYEQS